MDKHNVDPPLGLVEIGDSVTCTADAAQVQYEMLEDKTSPRLMSPLMYAKIFAALPEPTMVWLVDEDNDPSQAVLLDANYAAGEEMGIPLHDMRQSTLEQVLPEEHRELAMHLWGAHVEGASAEFTLEMLGKTWFAHAIPVRGVVVLVMWSI